MNYFEALIELLGIITLSGGTTFGVILLMRKLQERKDEKIKKIVLDYLKELQK